MAPGPEPESRLQEYPADDRSEQRAVRHRPLDVVFVEQMLVVVEVGEAIGRAAAQREQLYYAQHQVIQAVR